MSMSSQLLRTEGKWDGVKKGSISDFHEFSFPNAD